MKNCGGSHALGALEKAHPQGPIPYRFSFFIFHKSDRSHVVL